MVSRWVAAVNRQDAEELVSLAHPEVDYMAYLASLSGEAGAYKGHDGLRRYVGRLSAPTRWRSFVYHGGSSSLPSTRGAVWGAE